MSLKDVALKSGTVITRSGDDTTLVVDGVVNPNGVVLVTRAGYEDRVKVTASAKHSTTDTKNKTRSKERRGLSVSVPRSTPAGMQYVTARLSVDFYPEDADLINTTVQKLLNFMDLSVEANSDFMTYGTL